MSKKVISKQDVKNVAELLMKINDSTTTLEIKKELRVNGFWATQSNIADFMYAIYEEEGWAFKFNGSFRTYYLNDACVVDDSRDDRTIDDSDDSINQTKPLDNKKNDCSDCNDCDCLIDDSMSYTLKTGKVIELLDPLLLPQSHWKVSSNITNKIFYFDSKLNREEVRYVYYKMAEIEKGSNYKAEKINF